MSGIDADVDSIVNLSTGLYYYNARYYDPVLGRFISAGPIVSDSANPQDLKRLLKMVYSTP
jgi:RHS repeat-associated protein